MSDDPQNYYSSRKLAQTYVWHEDAAFFVSTINRRSSAVIAPDHIYAETIVWRWDPDKREATEMIWTGSDCADCIETHNDVVLKLFDTGEVSDHE